ncbi:hypothetical protein JXC34_00825 [Candidatus Woesearchaeota archaeon]|nr:hypothetical protein [Candidatus Woesearchaeota archaeon]
MVASKNNKKNNLNLFVGVFVGVVIIAVLAYLAFTLKPFNNTDVVEGGLTKAQYLSRYPLKDYGGFVSEKNANGEESLFLYGFKKDYKESLDESGSRRFSLLIELGLPPYQRSDLNLPQKEHSSMWIGFTRSTIVPGEESGTTREFGNDIVANREMIASLDYRYVMAEVRIDSDGMLKLVEIRETQEFKKGA